MAGSSTSLQYRRAALQHASVTGLVVALHDTLVGNLRRAADAITHDDIQKRCNELCHGFRVLQQLDSMLDMTNGGDTALTVRRFYTYVRGQMLSAQFQLSAPLLVELVQSILNVRQAWHQLDNPLAAAKTPAHVAVASLDRCESGQGCKDVVAFTCVG